MYKSFTYLTALLALLAAPFPLAAQQETADTTNIKKPIEENVVVETPKIKYAHSPKKAGWLSAGLPGLGQVYNKKWWKVPIVWAAVGTPIGFVVYNQRKYKQFKTAYINRLNGETQPDYDEKYSTASLFDIQDTYHNWRDLSIAITAGFYVLNILDAVVDAHFFRYDMGEDLTLQISPSLNFVKPGIGFTLSF